MQMKSQSVLRFNTTPSFGRAFTTKEEVENKENCSDAMKKLGVKNTTLVAFDFGFPSDEGKNTGIGTSFSTAAQNVVNFAKSKAYINSLQQGPQGTISSFNKSPYSGSVFALGEHLIDLQKLVDETYGSILPGVKKQAPVSDRVNYDYVLDTNSRKGAQTKALETAFDNFKKLPETDELKEDFETFKGENSNWLPKYCLYEALSKEHGVDNSNEWPEKDKNLFSGKYSPEQIKSRVEQIESNHADLIEFKEFTQFIADKQQQESKKNFNENDIKLLGDCLVGFSDKEFWANKSCFVENSYMGCPDKDENYNDVIRTWGFPALDYSKLGTIENPGETSKLLSDKFDVFFKKYDGARIDAAWQIVNPFVYKMVNDKPIEDGNRRYLGDFIIKLAENSAKKIQGEKYSPSNFCYELLGSEAGDGLRLTKNKSPHIHITRYAHGGWGRPAHYEAKSNDMYQNYSKDGYLIGLGTHDDISLVELSEDDNTRRSQSEFLANDLHLDREKLINDKEYFRNAKFAELFTAQNQFFTTSDFFGMKEGINNPKLNTDRNWTQRIPDNYEEFYHKQLSSGFGLNLPTSLAIALKAKGLGNGDLVKKLEKAGEILRDKGPYTQIATNVQLGENFSAISA